MSLCIAGSIGQWLNVARGLLYQLVVEGIGLESSCEVFRRPPTAPTQQELRSWPSWSECVAGLVPCLLLLEVACFAKGPYLDPLRNVRRDWKRSFNVFRLSF